MIVIYVTLFIGVAFGLFELINLLQYQRLWVPDRWVYTKRGSSIWTIAFGFALIFTVFMAWGIVSFLIEKGIPLF